MSIRNIHKVIVRNLTHGTETWQIRGKLEANLYSTEIDSIRTAALQSNKSKYELWELKL